MHFNIIASDCFYFVSLCVPKNEIGFCFRLSIILASRHISLWLGWALVGPVGGREMCVFVKGLKNNHIKGSHASDSIRRSQSQRHKDQNTHICWTYVCFVFCPGLWIPLMKAACELCVYGEREGVSIRADCRGGAAEIACRGSVIRVITGGRCVWGWDWD